MQRAHAERKDGERTHSQPQKGISDGNPCSLSTAGELAVAAALQTLLPVSLPGSALSCWEPPAHLLPLQLDSGPGLMGRKGLELLQVHP